MSRWPLLFAIAILGFSSAVPLPLFAQGVGGIPSSYGGTPLSPWLNLYQKQGGPVDNYHMFVQPDLQLRNTLQSQHLGIQRNAAAVGAVVNSLTTQAEAFNAAAEPTGSGASFLNHGAYFNTYHGTGLGAPGGRAGVSSSRNSWNPSPARRSGKGL